MGHLNLKFLLTYGPAIEWENAVGPSLEDQISQRVICCNLLLVEIFEPSFRLGPDGIVIPVIKVWLDRMCT